MTRDEWLDAFARRLRVEPPTVDDVEGLLEIAAVAAHASERTAAPVACWLVSVAGLDVERALRVATDVAPPA